MYRLTKAFIIILCCRLSCFLSSSGKQESPRFPATQKPTTAVETVWDHYFFDTAFCGQTWTADFLNCGEMAFFIDALGPNGDAFDTISVDLDKNLMLFKGYFPFAAAVIRYREFFGKDIVYDVSLNVTGCDEVNVITGSLGIVRIVLDVVKNADIKVTCISKNGTILNTPSVITIGPDYKSFALTPLETAEISFQFGQNNKSDQIRPISAKTLVSKTGEAFENGKILILKQTQFATCSNKLFVCINLSEKYYGYEPELKIQYISNRMKNMLSGVKMAVAVFKANFEQFETYLEFFSGDEIVYAKDELSDLNEISMAVDRLPEFLFETHFLSRPKPSTPTHPLSLCSPNPKKQTNDASTFSRPFKFNASEHNTTAVLSLTDSGHTIALSFHNEDQHSAHPDRVNTSDLIRMPTEIQKAVDGNTPKSACFAKITKNAPEKAESAKKLPKIWGFVIFGVLAAAAVTVFAVLLRSLAKEISERLSKRTVDLSELGYGKESKIEFQVHNPEIMIL